ncbi:HAUS augmin-like complex subunit 6 isoform X2 [Pelobates fuscus]|uniref:HAUS augmin-like complex subunit 6 isoform X2 n=1 Tax=Pelobates fuscus TaxID=191477 RepID=UPI002FE47651
MQSSSAPRPQPGWHKEHLWLALQALGFEPDSEAALTGKTMAHVTFGVSMFDKPNKDAFYVVFHFLFSKLDSTRCKEAFRYCWPPVDKKRDAEFRKVCCEWLRKISEDAGNGFPQVVASIFLSPGGPKFVHLLYHFVRYVMLQHIRKDDLVPVYLNNPDYSMAGSNSYVTEALQVRIQDPQKALARNMGARYRYLQVLQRENFVITEYQRKAQILVKQIRELRSDCVALENQNRSGNVSTDRCRNEKVEKIRYMWNVIMQSLKTIEKEVEVVDSVIKGNVDQYCLDGSNVTLNIPDTLVARIENEMYRLQMENVYEAGKVNLITVIQLLNEALMIVKQERCKQNCKGVPLDLQYLAGKAKFEMDILTRLMNIRHKIKRENIVAIDKVIAETEKEWEKKWTKVLGKSPFGVYKILDLQPSTFSHQPALEEEFSSILGQFAPCLPELSKETPTKPLTREDGALRKSFVDASIFTPTGRNPLSLRGQTPILKRRMSLNEQDFRTPSPYAKDGFLELTPKSAGNKRLSDTSWKVGSSLLAISPSPCKDPMSAARHQLAQQVADLIASESPRTSEGRAGELEDLLGMLSSDPFLSKKEIPRTPENLLSDIRSSWRKAIESESSDVVASSLEAPCLDSPSELDSAHCSQIDLSMACFMSTSHISDHNDSLDARFLPSTGTPVQQQLLTTIHNTNGTNTLEKGLSLPIKKSVSESLTLPVDKSKICVFKIESPNMSVNNPLLISVPRDENTSEHVLSWDSSKMVGNGEDSSEVIQFGILHETLPDKLGNLSFNSDTSAETNEIVQTRMPDLLLDKTQILTPERKMDIQSIRSRYEALKSTLLTSLTESGKSDQHTPSRFTKQKSESSLLLDSGSVFSPADRGLTLDLEYLMTPSNDRKLSLPQLISFSPTEDIHLNKDEFVDVFESQAVASMNKTFEFASDPLKSTDEGLGQLIQL